MVEIRFHPEAEDDYRTALEWYQARSPSAVDRFEGEVDRSLRAIVATPEMFPADENGNRSVLLRRFPFRLVYRKKPDHLQIIAVAHSSRAEDYWTDRE